MDSIKAKAQRARGRVAERTSQGTGSGSLAVPHSTLPPGDNSSTLGVNEGYLGPQPGTAARDFAVPEERIEPPTSLQSSVDAGTPIAVPPRAGNSGRPRASTLPDATTLQVPARGSSNTASTQLQPQRSRPNMGIRNHSIGIRRVQSSQELREAAAMKTSESSAAQLQQSPSRLAVLDEDCQLNTAPSSSSSSSLTFEAQPSRIRRASNAVQTALGFKKGQEKGKGADHGVEIPMGPGGEQHRDYNSNMVDVLDTLDPEIQTLTSLTNVQNSLFVPNLGRLVNRRPTYTIRRTPSEAQSLEEINTILAPLQQAESSAGGLPRLERSPTAGTMTTLATLDSRLSDSRFAVLPHGTSLEGWSKEDKKEMNDHVRHMLHSRRSKFKRSMRGFGQYVRRPLGFLVTLYATLITLFGLAWVLFLIGWINVGGRQLYIINVIDNVLVALFAVVGDGLAPFRAVDTYHMIYIAHYHHFTWARRKKQLLPKLHDHNDLPSGNAPISGPRVSDPEDPEKQWEFTVLTPKQQAKLEHHQAKFCKSHSFYRPHETETHHAFPLRLLITVVVLLDCHSLFQIALGACTWAIYYKVRPMALTTVILCCSITCNATAGLVILIGDKRTRKKDVLERMNRQELTEEAIHKVEKKKEKESESENEASEMSNEKHGRHSLHLHRHKQSGRQEESAYP